MSLTRCAYYYIFTDIFQDDLAFKAKQREEAKKLDEMRAKAGQRGPLGTSSR